MTDKLVIHGLDLTGMGVGDVVMPIEPDGIPLGVVLEQFTRELLGSITFGPVIRFEEEPVESDDWCPRGDEDRPFSD